MNRKSIYDMDDASLHTPISTSFYAKQAALLFLAKRPRRYIHDFMYVRSKFPTRLFSICAVSSMLNAVTDSSLYARLFPLSTATNSSHFRIRLWPTFLQFLPNAFLSIWSEPQVNGV